MTARQLHGQEAPSPWVRRWSHLIRLQGSVLDVACGHGRHSYWFHDRGHAVTLVDRSQDTVDSITLAPERCEKVVADIEGGPWPFTGRQFDAVVVTNYLWRPLMPALLASLAPAGVLIYETFTDGNETVGKPSRPDFLLRAGELLAACHALRVVAFEDGFQDITPGGGQPARYVQRIAAARASVNPNGQLAGDRDHRVRYAIPRYGLGESLGES